MVHGNQVDLDCFPSEVMKVLVEHMSKLIATRFSDTLATLASFPMFPNNSGDCIVHTFRYEFYVFTRASELRKMKRG